MCDGLTEALIYAMVVFAPWAFGTTERWSISCMNAAGLALGALLVAKGCVRWRTGYRPERWGEVWSDPTASGGEQRAESGAPRVATPAAPAAASAAAGRWVIRGLAALTVLILAYTLTSALNARATFSWLEDRFEYRECVRWLPHSYEAASTWRAFWQYLGLAGFFWALRDWLLGKTRRERHRVEEGASIQGGVPEPRLPERLKRLLWVVCLNGGLLALEGILQRLDGTNKLLWLVEPWLNKTAESQFGPYAYRSNAAQYLNLVWPLGVGLWWTLHRGRRVRAATRRLGSGSELLLLPLVVLMAAAPFVASSRGGMAVALGNATLLCGVLLGSAGRRRWGTRLAVVSAFLAALALGAFVGWPYLTKRLVGPAVRLPCPVSIGRSDFTLRTRFVVPERRPTNTVIVAGFGAQHSRVFAPESFVAHLNVDGSLNFRLIGDETTNFVQKTLRSFLTNHAGRTVEVVAVRTTNLTVYVEGAPQETRELRNGVAPAWNGPVAAGFLWVGHRDAASAYFRVPLQSVSVVARALTAAEVEGFRAENSAWPADAPPADLHYALDAPRNLWDRLVDPTLSGRTELYDNARAIARDFPWLGTGPATFPAVYHLYRANAQQTWAKHLHDDWLELRISFGRVGLSLLLLALLCVPLHWAVGRGIPVTPVFAAGLALALAGCLVHARFDFPLKVHSVLFQFLLVCGVGACVTRKP